jgi:hypothetical protein
LSKLCFIKVALFLELVSDNIVVSIDLRLRNTHLPAAWYKAKGGLALPLPSEVRWNSVSDTIQAYIVNVSKLLDVCEQHQDSIDATIARKVRDISIKRNCEDYLLRLQPLTVALDRLQAANCTLAESVEIWLDLKDALTEHLGRVDMAKVHKRMESNLTAHHYLANILHP